MCGIVGVAGALGAKDDYTLKRMLMLDYFRGPDSTGFAAIRNNGEVFIAKEVGDPVSLFHNKKFDTALNGMKSKVFIGHNRWATRGGVNKTNAHPFEVDHIVAAHNGTLDLTSWQRLEKALGEEFAVDSLALVAAIAKLGIKEAMSLCTSGDSAAGAWSLVWYDSIEDSLNFLRNEHRPMWLAYSKDFKKIFWASEWPMIDAAVRLSETGYEIYAEETTGYKYFPTDVDLHYKFDVSLFNTANKLPKPTVKEIKGREPVVVAKDPDPFGRQHGNVCGFNIHDHGGTKETKSRGKTRHSPDNVIHWLGNSEHPLAGYFNDNDFIDIVRQADGCCWWCGDPVFIESVGLIIFERDSLVLCGKCSGHHDLSPSTPSRIYVPAKDFEALRAV